MLRIGHSTTVNHSRKEEQALFSWSFRDRTSIKQNLMWFYKIMKLSLLWRIDFSGHWYMNQMKTTFLYVMFSCVFVTFSHSLLRHVRYLIVLIPFLCLLPYFYYKCYLTLWLYSGIRNLNARLTFFCLTSAESMAKIWQVKCIYTPHPTPVASAAV